MKLTKRIILYLIIASFFATGCTGSYQKLLKSTDNEAKYDAALKAYNEEAYHKAAQLFESILLYYRGPGKAETVHFYYAKSLMGLKDYYNAGYQFRSFTKLFPYSSFTEEAIYLGGYCKYLESPDYSLDQTITKDAVQELEIYIQKFPSGDRVAKAEEMIRVLKDKLIRKDYENAYNYYKTGAYQAAQTALKQFLKDHPSSSYKENAMYYIVKAGFSLAENSVESKKKERFEQAKKDYQQYIPLLYNEKYKNDLSAIYKQYGK